MLSGFLNANYLNKKPLNESVEIFNDNSTEIQSLFESVIELNNELMTNIDSALLEAANESKMNIKEKVNQMIKRLKEMFDKLINTIMDKFSSISQKHQSQKIKNPVDMVIYKNLFQHDFTSSIANLTSLCNILSSETNNLLDRGDTSFDKDDFINKVDNKIFNGEHPDNVTEWIKNKYLGEKVAITIKPERITSIQLGLPNLVNRTKKEINDLHNRFYNIYDSIEKHAAYIDDDKAPKVHQLLEAGNYCLRITFELIRAFNIELTTASEIINKATHKAMNESAEPDLAADTAENVVSELKQENPENRTQGQVEPGEFNEFKSDIKEYVDDSPEFIEDDGLDIDEDILEEAVTLVQSADEIYLLNENTIAKIRGKAVEISLLEAAVEEKEEKAKKLSANAGRVLIMNLIEKLKQFIGRLKAFYSNMKTKIGEQLDFNYQWAMKNHDRVLEKAQDKEALRNFTYQGHYWDLQGVVVDKAKNFIKLVDDKYPEGPVQNLSFNKMKDIIDENDNWSIDNFKDKMIKDAFNVKGEQFIAELASRLRGGEAKTIKGFAHRKPTDMLSILQNKRDMTATCQGIEAEIMSDLEGSLKAAEALLSKTNDLGSKITSEENNIMSHYLSKRIAMLNIAISTFNLVYTTKMQAIKEMSSEYRSALAGFIKA